MLDVARLTTLIAYNTILRVVKRLAVWLAVWLAV